MPACIIDMDLHEVIYSNTSYSQFIEYRDHNERRCYALMHGRETVCEECPITNYELTGERFWGMNEVFHAQSGKWITFHTFIVDLPESRPLCLCFMDIYNSPNLSSRQLASKHFDFLTGLVNFKGYENEGHALYKSAREQHQPLAIIAIKIEGLYQVNALYGYASGDDTLKKLSEAIRVSLPPDTLFARLRRNDFCALVPLGTSVDNDDLAQMVKTLCQLPLVMSAKRSPMALCQIFAGVSVLKNEESFEELNFLAWDACSRALVDGTGAFEIVEEQSASERITLKKLKEELPEAVAERRLELRYQPKFDVRSGVIVGAEALCRWNHSVYGMISPSLFIPMAERSGQIGMIDTWVIQEACRDLLALKKRYGKVIPVSVNISPPTFYDNHLEQTLLDACARYEISPSSIELELTERTALSNIDAARAIMQRLRGHGFRIAMDDFGVGYSSLSNLRRLPFDIIKIDRTFIANPCQMTQKIFPSVVSLVRSHEIELLIEGVETGEQLAMVQDAGCYYIQGFYFSRPLSLEQFIDKLSITN